MNNDANNVVFDKVLLILIFVWVEGKFMRLQMMTDTDNFN